MTSPELVVSKLQADSLQWFDAPQVLEFFGRKWKIENSSQFVAYMRNEYYDFPEPIAYLESQNGARMRRLRRRADLVRFLNEHPELKP